MQNYFEIKEEKTEKFPYFKLKEEIKTEKLSQIKSLLAKEKNISKFSLEKIHQISKELYLSMKSPIFIQEENPHLTKYENASILPVTFSLISPYETFNKENFKKGFSERTKIPVFNLRIISVVVGSTIVQMEISAFELYGKKYNVSAIVDHLTEEETCKRLSEFSVYLVQFKKPENDFKPLIENLIMNPTYNREYSIGNIFWAGPLNNDKVEPYYCPLGWVKYTCKIENSAQEFDEKYKSWPVVYHGTSFLSTMMISFTRLRSGGTPTTKKGGDCFGAGFYFTPSIIYASHPRYANPWFNNGKWTQVVLNFRLRPKTYIKRKETLEVENKFQIDRNYSNDQIEWLVPKKNGEYIDDNTAIFCGYMIREVDKDPITLPSSKW